MLDYEHARHRMVDTHIARRGVRDERILSALRQRAICAISVNSDFPGGRPFPEAKPKDEYLECQLRVSAYSAERLRRGWHENVGWSPYVAKT